MNFRRILACFFFLSPLLALQVTMEANPKPVANATNEFGLDLYRRLATGKENLCLSPYSIECALAMTFAGSEGETRNEMARVLHLPPNRIEVHGLFAALQKWLEEMVAKSAESVAQSKKLGGASEPIMLTIANRLFAQRDYDFRPVFLALVKASYRAPMEPLDFVHDSAGATKTINDWVAEQTRKKIRELIPMGALDETTRMVLANALYLKAPWAQPFEKESTQPEPFHVHGGEAVNVPMMHRRDHNFGYAKYPEFVAANLPYSGGELNFLVLLPDSVNGLANLEAKLTPKILAECAKLPTSDINLSMPRFKF